MKRVYRFVITTLISLSLLLSLIGVQTGQASSTVTIIRVATTGENTTTCGTADEPCETIQKAVNKAASGDIILVAGGVYSTPPTSPDSACYAATTTKPIFCVVNKHLTIRGGYSTSNWNVSDPVANPTIIDGLDEYRGVALLGSSNVSVVASLTLENFTIQHGLARGATGGTDYALTGAGGGIYIDKANFTLRNIIFQHNRALGGNTSQSYGGKGVGGAIWISDMPPSATGILENLTIAHNQAIGGTGSARGGFSLGGGLYIWKGKVNGSYLTLTHNLAQAGHTSGYGRDGTTVAEASGGGLSIHDGVATFSHMDVSYNQAIGGNGTTYAGGAYGGGLELETSSSLIMTDSIVKGNLAAGGNAQNAAMAGGGGFLWDRTNVTLDRVQILSNIVRGGQGTIAQGSAGGGGIYATLRSGANTGTVLNSLIADNSLELASGSGSLGGGGGLWIQGYPVEITHSTISNNRLDPQQAYGAALIAIGLYMPAPSNVTLTHSMITNHVDTNPDPNLTQSALHIWTMDTANLNRSLFAGNANDTNLEGDPANDGGPGTFNGMATMLYASSAGYIAAGAPYHNYHLRMDSFARDQADTSTIALDFEIDYRPFAAIADIGADEYHPFGLSVTPFSSSGLHLNWSKDASGINPLLNGIDHYAITVACPVGANPPDQGSCGAPFTVGSVTQFSLTGLSANVQYTITIQARDSSETALTDSIEVASAPTNLVFVPLTLR